MSAELDFDYYPQADLKKCPFAPAAELAEARETTSRVRIALADGSHVWLIIGYHLARRVLASPCFSSDPLLPGFPALGALGVDAKFFSRTMIRRDGPEHRRLRMILTPLFTPAEVERQLGLIESVINRAIEELRDHRDADAPSKVDLIERYAKMIPTSLIAELIGLKPATKDDLNRLTLIVFDPKSSSDEKRIAFDELDLLIREVLEAPNVRDVGSPTIKTLIGHVDERRLDLDELAAMLVHLVLAGHHTTGSNLGLILRFVLDQPQLRAAALESEESAGAVVDELLRYVSVVRGTPRRLAVSRTEIDGFVFEAGDGVVIALQQANHDPEVFGNPQEIDITRKNMRQHVAFGFGPHQCLGQALARREIVVAVRALLRAFPDIRLSETSGPLPLQRDNINIFLSDLNAVI